MREIVHSAEGLQSSVGLRKLLARPRQLCCPTDGVGLNTAGSMSVPGPFAEVPAQRTTSSLHLGDRTSSAWSVGPFCADSVEKVILG